MAGMINCYEYCINRAKYDLGNSFDDEMIMMAHEIGEKEEQLKDVRGERWSLATIGLNRAGSVILEVTDKTALKVSIDREQAIEADIARNKAMFTQLNPIFGMAQESLVRFVKPSLKELITYKQECENRAFLLERELKTELHYRLTSGKTKTLTLDEVLADPGFCEHKAKTETTIRGLRDEAGKAAEFISRIEGILRN